MWLFWRFVGGLLGLKSVMLLVSFLDKSRSEEIVLSAKKLLVLKMICFAEALTQPCLDDQDAEERTRSMQEAAGALLAHTLDLSCGILRVSDMHAMSVCLAQAKHVKILDLSFCDLDHRHAGALSVNGGLRYVHSLYLTGNPKLPRPWALCVCLSGFRMDLCSHSV